MTDDSDRELLIEATASAFRERDPDGRILAAPAFADLDDEGRVEAFAIARDMRALEVALDPHALSSTAHAVIRPLEGVRIPPAGRLRYLQPRGLLI